MEKPKIYTTLRILRQSNACIPRYKHLVKGLGGALRYGDDTPITLTQILDINGFEDLVWVLADSCPIALAKDCDQDLLRELKNAYWDTGHFYEEEVIKKFLEINVPPLPKPKLYTTFAVLRINHACTARYKYLAKKLGGVMSYGESTPISIKQILEICGIEDTKWVLSTPWGSALHFDSDPIEKAAIDTYYQGLWLIYRTNRSQLNEYLAKYIEKLEGA